MTTRQFFTWSFWAVVIILGLPFLMVVVNGGGGANSGQTSYRVKPLPTIVHREDFPSTYFFEKQDVPWQMYPGISQTRDAHYYRFIANVAGAPENQQWGNVTIVRYTDPHDASEAFEVVRRETAAGRTALPIDFAESGSKATPSGENNGSDVVFVRCGTIVHLGMERDNMKMLLTYGRQLDERIVSVACI